MCYFFQNMSSLSEYIRRVDIPHDTKKIKTKGFSTVFYSTGYSQWPKKVYQNLTHKSPEIQVGRHWP